MTIEERATNAWKNNGLRGSYMLGYIEGATEQDRIAREEERERCIKAAQEWWCKNHCSQYRYCIKGLGNTHILASECSDKSELREAIEEGGNNGND